MPPVYRDDAYASFNFRVIISTYNEDGTAIKGSFAEIAGMDAEVAPIEYRVGSEKNTPRKLPGLQKYTNVTLKRGWIGHPALANWLKTAQDGSVQRADVAIILCDENRQEVTRWNFVRAWACKWQISNFNAKNNEIAMETLEFAHEGVTLA